MLLKVYTFSICAGLAIALQSHHQTATSYSSINNLHNYVQHETKGREDGSTAENLELQPRYSAPKPVAPTASLQFSSPNILQENKRSKFISIPRNSFRHTGYAGANGINKFGSTQQRTDTENRYNAIKTSVDSNLKQDLTNTRNSEIIGNPLQMFYNVRLH